MLFGLGPDWAAAPPGGSIGEENLPGLRRKHVPLRTCIICQQKRPKRDLIRIVRTPEGVLALDGRGKLPGRGAYFCPEAPCWEEALKPARLSRVLKQQVSDEELASLRAEARTTATQLQRREANAGIDTSDRLSGGGR